MKRIPILIIITIFGGVILFMGIGCKTTGTTVDTSTEATVAETTVAETTVAETTVAETTEQKQIRIGFSLPQSINVIFTQSGQIMEELGLNDGVEVITQYANDDTSLQASQIENMLTQGIDVLVICAVDMDAIKSSVDAAKADGIPVVCFTRTANNSDVDYMVRMSYYSVGYEAAKLAHQMYPEGNYGLINGDNGDDVAHVKRQGAIDFLDPFVQDGTITIVTDQWTKGWKVEEALKLAENALTANNNDI
ncbi:MAG: substrate-binding domain-containing protein, partial [Actinobacteria bacterium]|nr:substrate-binding domain-containing protein [Actinomycetota bacterium]